MAGANKKPFGVIPVDAGAVAGAKKKPFGVIPVDVGRGSLDVVVTAGIFRSSSSFALVASVLELGWNVGAVR